MARRGLFITLEGPEGSGKSSQARQLVRTLRRAGYSVVFACDPGSTTLGRRLRRVLLHERRHLTAITEALLFIAGRIQLVEEVICPALARGKVVVCDRFHDSTVAYQGFGGGVNVRWLDTVGRLAIGGVMPNLTILLDLPTRVGFTRLTHARDRMERKALVFHQRVRQGYRRLARREPKRFVVINATKPKSHVQQQISATVLKRLSTRH